MKITRISWCAVLALVATFTTAALPAAEKGFDDPARLLQLVREGKPPYLLVDVRTPEEYAAGHIPTAINVPVDVIAQKPPTRDKAALIIVYCRSGNRSATARKILQDLGYTNLVDFGAVTRWESSLVTGTEPGTPPR